MSVCCTFRLTYINKSMLTANIAMLLVLLIIRGTFRTFPNVTDMSTSLHLQKVHIFCTSLQVKVLPKSTLLLMKSKLFYLSKVTK